MKPYEYINKALRTDSKKYNFKSVNGVTPPIEHAAYGLATESGEIIDALKKAKFQGKELDKVNLVEEAGDIMWYLAILCNELGVSFEEVWDKNIRKLKTRYPEKYTDFKSKNRDLQKERKELEK